jgi:hypothetical protein
VLKAYFDESGTDAGSEVVTLAGYVSPEERWERLAIEWSAVLRNPRFAIGEFKTADWYGRYGEFRKFRDPRKQRDWQRLWIALTGVIGKRVRFGVTVSIPARQHATLTESRLPERSVMRDPYWWGLQACLEAIVLAPERKGEKVKCILDDGHKHKGLVTERALEIIRDRGWDRDAIAASVTRASSSRLLTKA